MTHFFTSGAGSLNFSEFQALLARCACIINDRPLGVRHHNKAVDEVLPITPNLLLLGRTSSGPLDTEKFDEGNDRYTCRAKFVDEILSLWWDMWYAQVFDSLFPLPKWKEQMPNLKAGDICMLKYDRKVGKGDYRLCRVDEVHPDEKGLVRTVTVAFRPISNKDKSLPYISKALSKMKVGLSRLILICPVENIDNNEEIIADATDL